MTEAQIQDSVRLELGRDPDLVLWRNNVGMATMKGGAKVRFGVGGPGASDLIGLFRGRFVAIEIKTPIGRLAPEQRMFRDLVEKKGGTYVVIRSADEARQWLATMKTRAA